MAWFVSVVAIISIAIMVCIALANGINGIALASGIAAVAGVGGFTAKVAIDKLKKAKQ